MLVKKAVDEAWGCLHCNDMMKQGARSLEHGARGGASLGGCQFSVGSRQFSARTPSGFWVFLTRYSSPTTRRSARRAGAGFTLIELLVVIAVIAILAGITLAAMGGVQQRAARNRTQAEISAIANALEAYRSQHGQYPRESADNTVPYTNIAGYLASERITVEGDRIKDPFGSDYVYISQGTRNRAGFDLFSYAGAGTNETHKHIGNW